MRGTIAKKGNRYYPVVDLGKDPVTGKRKRKWHPGHDRKKDAQKELNAILGRMQSGTYVEPHKQTLGEFCIEWLEARRDSVKKTTHANYTHQLQSYVLPHLGSRRLQELTAMELSAFYAGLAEDGRAQSEGGLSARSVLNVHQVLRKALNDAVKWGLLVRNPVPNAELPKAGSREMKTWTPGQVKSFLESEEDTREYALWYLACTTGMRRGELLGLSWSAIDFDAGRLKVTQTLVNVDNVPTFTTPKTDAGKRSIELDAHTVRVLGEHRRRQVKERLRAGSAWQDHDLVFCQADGTPFKPERITRHFNSRVKAVGLPKIRFHDLRHTYATAALGAGEHPMKVSKRLGHSSIQVTLDTYSHVTPEMDKAVAERVSALFR